MAHETTELHPVPSFDRQSRSQTQRDEGTSQHAHKSYKAQEQRPPPSLQANNKYTTTIQTTWQHVCNNDYVNVLN